MHERGVPYKRDSVFSEENDDHSSGIVVANDLMRRYRWEILERDSPERLLSTPVRGLASAGVYPTGMSPPCL